MRKLLFCLLLIPTLGLAQEATVEGIVLDGAFGSPLPGVNVVVKGTSNGATTDFDGGYSISNVGSNETLEFSYVGYVTQQIPVNNQTTINTTLQEDLNSLDEVVVIGYGTQKKKEITGAVSTLKAEIIADLQPQKAIDALTGTLSGVEVTKQGGNPGSGFNINIRGVSSNSNNGPTVYIDGALSDLDNINPEDIETFTVLKDAQAAIYGSNAANGVILVTTKSGKKNQKTTIEYNAYVGFQEVSKKINVLNATEYALVQNEKAVNSGAAPVFTNIPALGKGTDWQDEIFQSAPLLSHSFRLSGGSEKIGYSLSASHLDQLGALGADKAAYFRDNARLKVNVDLYDNLKLNTDVNFVSTHNRGIYANGLGSVTFNAINFEPYLPSKQPDGSFTLGTAASSNEVINPLAQIDNTGNNYDQDRFSGVVSLNYEIVKNLTLTPRLALTSQTSKLKQFSKAYVYGPGKTSNINTNEENNVSERYESNSNYIFDFAATYDNMFKDKHHVTVTGGTYADRIYGFGNGAIAYNVPFNSWEFADLELVNDLAPGSQPTNTSAAGFFKYNYNRTRSSVFGRLQYDYKGKYLISAMYRSDKSSLFSPKFNTANFPSFTAGWIVSEEKFLQDNNVLSFMKIRGSYGILGNDKALENFAFAFIPRLGGEAQYALGGGNQILNGTAIGKLANEALKWEESEQFDVGLDLGFFDNTLNIVADYFIKDTKDLLLPIVPGSGILGGSAPGSSNPAGNAGTVRNKGFEFSANYKKDLTKNLKITLGTNFTSIDNVVTKVNNGSFIEEAGFRLNGASTRFQEGLPIGAFYGLKTEGIFQNVAEVNNHASYDLGFGQPSPGDLKYIDVNNDGVINNDDRTEIGTPFADFTLGFNMGIDYKGFDFSIYTYASVGNKLIRSYERENIFVNQLDYVLGRWTGPGSTNEIPRLTQDTNNNNILSEFFVEDASYFRINNIQLGYSLPADSIDAFGLSKLRIYATINNLHTFTEYKGYDPAAQSGNIVSRGLDNGFYPSTRNVTMGLNMKF